MKVGDLVVFRGDEDRVTGLIVAERESDALPVRRPRMGVWWSDHDQVEWEPVEYMDVISENR
jgi:hypothetical protein